MNKKPHGITFGEVVSFIEELDMNATDTILVFQLLDLIKLYDAHLKDRITLETRTQSKPFRNRLLSQFEDFSAYKEWKEVILVFNHNIAEAITTTAKINHGDNSYVLTKAS